MCGIAGLVLGGSGSVKRKEVCALFQHLKHRGPDDAGLLCHHQGKVDLKQGENHKDFVADVVLVHCRLSILDLSEAGWQPMGTPEGRYYIVFNGEIYNYLELRDELEALDYQFCSHSDTEVLLAAYAQWGAQGLNRLVGMFALAILDVQKRKLFLARDFFGIKPLYYTYYRSGIAFASEIKALLALSGVSRQVNPQRLYDYLCFGLTDHGEETLFADIRQLPAAHYMEVSLENPQAARPVRYWQVDLHQGNTLSFDAAAERLRELFLQNVRLHLRSDVPVGAALSGGIDSSSIVMAMRYLEPDLDIHAFSYIANGSPVNEEHWIDIVGAAANIAVHKVGPNPEELVADLEHLIGVQEEPFISTSIYAQHRVFKRAREAGIKVMLDGQGADELLGGYFSYIPYRIGSLLSHGRLLEALRLSCNASRLPRVSALSLWPQTMSALLPLSLKISLRHWMKKDRIPPWLNAAWFKEWGVVAKNPFYSSRRELLKEALHISLAQEGLFQLLHYEDRNSMAFSIESRVPFLTPALVNFVFSLPEAYLLTTDGTTKAVFRKAMRGIVPSAILDRRDKIGFATPGKKIGCLLFAPG